MPDLYYTNKVKYIKAVQAYNYRVKLRGEPLAEEHASGPILGWYYSGTPVFELGRTTVPSSLKNGLVEWSLVRVGGRLGYMMSEFLVDYPDCDPSYAEVFPMEGETAAFSRITSVDHIVTGNPFQLNITAVQDTAPDVLPVHSIIRVLGILKEEDSDEGPLHIAVDREDGTVYGFLSSEEAAWTWDHQTAKVRALVPDELIPLRQKPDASSQRICSLYPGTEVMNLFTTFTSGAGWTRVRLDKTIGYVITAQLDFDAQEFPLFRPQPARLKVTSAALAAGLSSKVVKDNMLFVLGKRTGKTGSYLCLTRNRDQDGDNYLIQTGYIPQKELILPEPGGVSTKGTLTADSCLYTMDEEGGMVKITDSKGVPVVYPEKSEFVISYALNGYLRKEGGPLAEGYLTRNTAWVYVELRVPEQYKGVRGFLPISVISFDPRLILPGYFTGD